MKFIQLAAMAFLAVVAQAQVSADELVSDINTITQLSSETNDVAQSVSTHNFANTAPVGRQR